MKASILRKIIWVVTIIYMGIIFFLSARPVEVSRGDSAMIMSMLLIADSQEEAADVSNSEMMRLNNLVRRYAHFVIFGGLGGLYFLSLYGFNRFFEKIYTTAPIALLLTIIYGISDEIHQIFSHRGARITDVITDAKGGLTIILIMSVIFCITPIDKFFKSLMTIKER